MKPTSSGRNKGEGDRKSARRYNRKLREFISQGKVDPAAREAESYVEREPHDAERAERAAKRGPHGTKVSVDELVAKGRTVFDRMRPLVSRVVARARKRFHK
jgi:hypothetical protein